MIKIAHLADIHYRGLVRHSEYKKVFNSFINDAKNVGVDLIFVAGDIFHTKTSGISPEYVDEISNWMKDLASVAPVHMILGNHDGNLVNLTRQDAITPIYNLVSKQKTINPIFLRKYSGTYELTPEINLCLFSIFDNDWDKVTCDSKKINIATYHGPVQGAKLESGIDVGGDIAVDHFDKFDFVMLGDIHKRQTLAKRKTDSGEMKPWICYPGSTIQQTFAEDLEHGYLLWQIDSKNQWDVSFRKLINPNPFITINWSGNKKDTLNQLDKVNNARVRIKSDKYISPIEIQDLQQEIIKKTGAIDVTYDNTVILNSKLQTLDSFEVQRNDLRNSSVIINLLKSYYKNKSITLKNWNPIKEIINGYLKNISNDNIERNVRWTIKSLEFDNTFGYNEGNKINFDSLSGITGIFGPNRSGKSSIPGTIMYTLYNSTDRGPIKNHYICNDKQSYCMGKIKIGVGSTDYIIERLTTKTKKGTTSSTALNFWKVGVDGELIDLVGEQRSDTDKLIRTIIGSADDFLLTSMSTQGESDLFIKQKSTARWKTLARYLDLEIFGKMYEQANDDLKSYKSKLTEYPERDWDQEEMKFKADIQKSDENILEYQDHINDLMQKIHNLKLDLSKKSDVNIVTQDQYDKKLKRRNLIQDRYDNIKKEIKLKQDKIDENIITQNKIDAILKKYSLEELKQQADKIISIRNKVLKLQHSVEKNKLLLKQQRNSAKLLNTVPCGDEYPTCKFIKEAHNSKQQICDQNVIVEEACKLLSETQNSLDKLVNDNVEDQLKKLTALSDKKQKIKISILSLENEIIQKKSIKDQLESELFELKTSCAEMYKLLNNNDNIEVNLLRTNIDKIQTEIKNYDNKRIHEATNKGNLKLKLQNLIDEKNKRAIIVDKINLYDLITKAFSRKGLPREIIMSQLPTINAEISNILNNVVDYTIEFSVADGTDNLDLYLKYPNSKRLIELGSGMEKMMGILALRTSLSVITSLPKSDTLFVDEGFGSLDPEQIQSCNKMLEQLKQYYKNIVVISHVDAIKDATTNIIEINQINKGSHVLYD